MPDRVSSIDARVAVLEHQRTDDRALLAEVRDDVRGMRDDSLPKMREALDAHRRESAEHWAKVRGALWLVGVVWVLLSAALPFLRK